MGKPKELEGALSYWTESPKPIRHPIYTIYRRGSHQDAKSIPVNHGGCDIVIINWLGLGSSFGSSKLGS